MSLVQKNKHLIIKIISGLVLLGVIVSVWWFASGPTSNDGIGELEFTAKKVPYDRVKNLTSVDGSLVYAAFDSENNSWFVLRDGERISNNYNDIEQILDISGEVAFLAKKDEDKFIVHQGKKIGVEYNSVSSPVSIKGKLAYIAENNNEFVVYNGEKSKEYRKIDYLTNVNGKLAYGVLEEKGDQFVVYDDEKIKEYNRIYNVESVGGKLAYLAGLEDEDYFDKKVIVYDGKEITRATNIRGILEVGDKLAYTMGIERLFIKYNGEVYSGSKIVKVGEKLAYDRCTQADKTSKAIPTPCVEEAVVYGGNLLKKYDSVSEVINLNGKLAYIATEDDSWYIITES